MRTLLRNRALLTVGLAETVSGLGNWITAMAVYALVIYRGGGGPAEGSAIFLAYLLPMLICSPVAGWLCDHHDRRRLLMAGELLSGLAVVGLIFARRPVLIYGLLAVQSAFGAVITPARQAAVPQLVARQELHQANALLQQVAGLIKIGGPFLGGLILVVVEPHQAMVLDVLSFAIAALILSRLPALPATPSATTHTSSEPATAGGPGLLGTLRRLPLLALLYVATFLVVAVIAGYDVLGAVYARDVLRSDEGLYGLMVGMIGAGTVAATLALMVDKGERDPLRDMVVGLFLLTCIPAFLAVGASLPPGAARWLALAGCFLGGLGDGVLIVQISTLLQVLSPQGMLGRLSGAWQSTLVAGQLVAALAVPVVVPQWLTASRFLGLAAVAMAGLGLAMAVVWRRGMGVAATLMGEA